MSALRDFLVNVIGVDKSKLLNQNGPIAGNGQPPNPLPVNVLGQAVFEASAEITAPIVQRNVLSAAPANSPAPTTNGQPTKAAPLSGYTVMVLVDTLKYLSSDAFLQGSAVPEQPKDAGEASVNKVLGIVWDAVRNRNDRNTAMVALQQWNYVHWQLDALIDKARSSPEVTPEYVKPAYVAEGKIDNRMQRPVPVPTRSVAETRREAEDKLNQAIKEIETPDLEEATGVRELKKVEPALKVWQAVIGKAGSMGSLTPMKRLSGAINAYFSVPDPSAKVRAVREAGVTDKKTVLELAHFVGDIMKDAAVSVTEEGIKAAEKAGNQAAVHALEKRLNVVRGVTGALALYQLAKGTEKLITGILHGDWKEIAEGAVDIAFGAVGLAEAITGIEVLPAGGAVVVGVVIKAEAEMIGMVADQLRWAKDFRALKAFQSMVADTKKIIPIGIKEAAAENLMLVTDSLTPEYEVYQKQATQFAQQVKQNLGWLAGNHVNRKDLDSVGGYPALVKALGQRARDILDSSVMGVAVMSPFGVAEEFKTVLSGIKSMAIEGDRLYGAAG